ncbi:hypothetical protein [Acetobacter nitrogenifigens]|uniref:hypothetical protein n=1 Tax=Acetobacter nitrogenifigens TaxID=285268 RepID=UPI000405A5E6|nr:hypothetical protein [Acetobacter nitrogenifigens]
MTERWTSIFNAVRVVAFRSDAMRERAPPYNPIIRLAPAHHGSGERVPAPVEQGNSSIDHGTVAGIMPPVRRFAAFEQAAVMA